MQEHFFKTGEGVAVDCEEADRRPTEGAYGMDLDR
jgi:hypothetical protein